MFSLNIEGVEDLRLRNINCEKILVLLDVIFGE